METILSAGEAARLLNLHVKTVYALARAGRLPATKSTGKWLFSRPLLEEWVASQASRGDAPPPAPRLTAISARNQLTGTITRLTRDRVMAEVVVDVGGIELVSTITRASADRLDLRVGRRVVALIKASEVLIAETPP